MIADNATYCVYKNIDLYLFRYNNRQIKAPISLETKPKR